MPETGPASGGKGRRILLVEDDPDLGGLIAEDLRKSGYEVVFCADGEEALRALPPGAQAPDLVISDLTMPRMGGLELAGLLRLRFPGIRILLSSGYSQEELLQDPRHEGLAFLGKPYDLETLRLAVKNAIDGTRG